ncbi:metal ABC transporter solute-binding protein, Zn/Mn family [Breznakiella homolactica]|uniref:Zinc ABC transporter substrate-binding protein n=1 Tax=Breznakiella homolactica TaxID=2798577 RepID=A0A7T7XN35_9SPIR|nr:zinc ABC transporter substrate-binding protein [Breznakiella homolactica]QQO09323.1 zinc ABC transporter substrate-binding protein [Breznakiella homolactica]
MVRSSGLWCIAVFAVIIAGSLYGNGGQEQKSGKPIIAVSILPQSYFIERIAGDLAETVVLVGPGQSPHSYEPTPRQMALLAEARGWVLSNTDFEISLKPKIEELCPDLVIVDGTDGVQFRMLDSHGHSEPSGSGPVHGMELDRHTWLGREPAKIMAAHIRDLFISIDGDHAALYEQNYTILAADIDREFDSLGRELEPLRGRTVFVYHPSFGYFLDEFGIEQEAVETGGKEPTPRVLAELIEKAQAENAAAIFVQAQFPLQSAKTVADSVGARVIPLDPLAPDWLANIRFMGKSLKDALTGEVP